MPISETARRALYARETTEVFLGLIKITHPNLATPLRFVNNTANVTSSALDTGSWTFTAAPFNAQVPPQAEGGEPTVTIVVNNVDRVVEEALSALTEPPEFAYAVVLASSPNTTVLGPFELPLRSAETTQSEVRLTLGGSDPLLSHKWPKAVFTQDEFPGLNV